jgi:serine/threonine protein kinase
MDDLHEHLTRSLSGLYSLERELSGGGMARVFLAEETALGRKVVLKVLPSAVAQDLSAERFAREIRTSARLQHPNIVSVLTAGAADGVPYYAMPFIEGESLRARLDRLGPNERLPLHTTIGVLRDVARALAYAHTHGVVHRDIKPENVLLAHDAAVVADFGVAKAMDAARAVSAATAGTSLTQRGIALGTPAYMAPEQAAGDSDVDQRADVYAWGVLAYELLAGTHPFAGRQSLQAMIKAHLVEPPPPLDEGALALPHAVVALVMRCLAKERGDRPGDARELAEAFETAVSDRRGPSRRVVGRVAAAAVVMAAIGGVTVYVSTRPSSAAPSPAARPPISSTAYDLYLRGRVHVSSENRQDNEQAIDLLRQAVAADPALAPAHAELARAYLIKVFYFGPDSEKKALNVDAEVAVEKALSLDPNLGEAHFARGLMLWTPARRFPHEQAISAYRRALALNPKLDEAHHQMALVYLHVGLFDRAWDELEEALAINPGNTLARFRFGVIDLYRGQFESALAIFNSTPLESNPSMWAFQAATALFRLGREEEATALVDRLLREYPNDEGGVGTSVRAMVLAKAGRPRDAEAAIQRSIELGRGLGHFHHTAYNIASAYALLGRADLAIRWLQDAADDGFPCYPLFASDTQLDPLRADPRFIAMMAKLRSDFETRNSAF